MGYDIELVNPETKKVLEVPPHRMYGTNVRVKEDDGVLVPVETTEAHLSITYNYADWYRLAFDKGEEYYDSIRDVSYVPEYAYQSFEEGLGIRSIYGMTGETSIGELDYVIQKIEDRTWRPDMDITELELEQEYIERIEEWNEMSDEEKAYSIKFNMTPERRTIDDYYVETREHVLIPLYQLKTLAELRPEGIWAGD